ncbi:MAG TPA: hypothetical protein VD838_17075 [Anaeromyxobacteraceae bacterium]|nr:hypothetical protein [Anaeromyxobacteraceae bacterium]
MPGTGSRPRAPRAAIALVLALAGCTEREIDVTPFRIEATLDGAPLSQGIFEFAGVGGFDGERTMHVTSGTGQVLSVSFSDGGGAEVRFPDDVQGRDTIVRVQVDDAHQGPDGEPLRIPAMHLVTRNNAGFFEFRMVMGEGTYRTEAGLGALPILFQPVAQDFPLVRVVADSLYFEPAECGLVYYDRLRVEADEREDLKHDTTERVALGLATWNVRHVLSWHRQGDCPDDVRTWTQVALWR